MTEMSFFLLQVTEAAISKTCGRLAVISVPQQSIAQETLKGPVEIHVWDMHSNTNWKVLLSSQPSISRQLIVGCDYLVSFVQTRKNVSDTDNLTSALQRRSARGRYSQPDVNVAST